MSSMSAYWWLLLPLIILPIMWLRQKRESSLRQSLATAKFLAAASPHMVQVWRWQAWLLLILRCLLLLIAIAYLASIFMRWRGDTVLIASGSDSAWVEQQINASKMQDAKRMSFCANISCDIQSTQILYWLEQHQSWWKESARLLVLGDANQIRLNAQSPQLAQALEVKVRPPSNANKQEKTKPADHYIALHSDRAAAWQHMFTAFAAAGRADHNYVWQQAPDAQTELVIWDSTQAVPQNWKTNSKAHLWWLSSSAGIVNDQATEEKHPGLQSLADGKTFIKQFKTAESRYWLMQSGSDWPISLNDRQNAKKLFEAWQVMSLKVQDYPATSFTLPASKNAIPLQQQENTRDVLLVLLLCIFALERILTHVGRR
ncbi:hypothetical protein [Undibacterium sp. Di24W]|uniref:hypothetical protein n=1 Tax=Undibacterium sp. Di24W TaxID=3413033 RepID=UPI003BEFB086